jgi:hypothetical protein
MAGSIFVSYIPPLSAAPEIVDYGSLLMVMSKGLEIFARSQLRDPLATDDRHALIDARFSSIYWGQDLLFLFFCDIGTT